jgi:hypothetical protein
MMVAGSVLPQRPTVSTLGPTTPESKPKSRQLAVALSANYAN